MNHFLDMNGSKIGSFKPEYDESEHDSFEAIL